VSGKTWDFRPWLRALFGFAVLAVEVAWLHRTQLWIDVPLGGGIVVLAGVTSLIRWLLPFLFFSLFLLIPRWRALRQSTHEETLVRWRPVAAHVVCSAACAVVTLQLVHAPAGTTGTAWLAALWFILAVAGLVTLGAASLPASLLAVWDRRTQLAGCAAAAASVVALPLLQGLWTHSSDLSVHSVRWVLEQLRFHVVTMDKIVGTDRFSVLIAPVCSGYEGMGLFLVFSVAWLAWFRKEYRFPAALLLLPIGLAISWGLNVLRIAGLIVIGHYGHPKIAMGGFHTEAGWLAFTILAIGFCALSHQVPGMRAGTESPRREEDRADDPAAVYLGPLLAIQAAAMISVAASSGFEWLYPLRVLAPLAVLLWYRKDYARFALGPSRSAYAAGIGVAVSGMWALAAWHSAPNSGGLAQLPQLPVPWRAAWWFFRFAGAVVVVPLAEELAFRGYLMRRVKGPEVEKVDPGRAGWLGLALSSLAFGLLHGSRWMEGVVAGLLYGHVYARRGRLGDAIVAHAITNLILLTLVVWTGDWRFW
jgi:exosortase E/protease (VPEID-CTERM system)